MQKLNTDPVAAHITNTTYCIIYPVDAILPYIRHTNMLSPNLEKEQERKRGKLMRKRMCAPIGCERSSLAWIGVNLLYTLQSPPSFLRFLVYSRFSLPISSPAAGCRLNRADGDWYPLTSSCLSPFFRWHRERKCEPSARQEDSYNTAVEAAERRSCCTEEAEREEKSAD